MNPDFTLIWPLSCLKDGDHLSPGAEMWELRQSRNVRIRSGAVDEDGVGRAARAVWGLLQCGDSARGGRAGEEVRYRLALLERPGKARSILY